MDKYYDASTPEYRAHYRIKDNSFWEDNERGSLNEQLIALSASYQALARYIAGADIYLMPRNVNELHEKLKRYAADAIHNTIAQSRLPLEPGGYGRVLNLAHQSIRSVLTSGRNSSELLRLHQNPESPTSETSSSSERSRDTNTPSSPHAHSPGYVMTR